MANSDFRLTLNESDKHIDDVIDARKKIGQYDVHRHPTDPVIPQNSLYRSAHSTPACINEECRQLHSSECDGPTWLNESDLCSYPGEPGIINIGPTDSEITIVRVKREGLQYKSGENKWNLLHDDAVPGDGTHLGESPSLVNLVTLVDQPLQYWGNNAINNNNNSKINEYNQYLVPLSSWDPCDHPYNLPDIFLSQNRTCREELNKSEFHIIKPPNLPVKRPGLAGRLSNFIRKRCLRKSKTSVSDVTPPENLKTAEEMNARSGKR